MGTTRRRLPTVCTMRARHFHLSTESTAPVTFLRQELKIIRALHAFRGCMINNVIKFPSQLSNDEDKAAFIEDYRMTACISILQWFCMEFKKLGPAGVECFDAKARRSVVEFSLLRCKEFVASFSHQDVDVDADHVWEHQWDQFLTDFYLVCHENSKIQVLINCICELVWYIL
jgi:hypothetical protein